MRPTRTLLAAALGLGSIVAGCREVDPHRVTPPPSSPPPGEAPQPIEATSAEGTPPARGALPSPLVSRAKRVVGWSPAPYARPGDALDQNQQTVWAAGKPTPEKPAWIAIDVGVGPSRLLLDWSAAGSFNYEETDYGSPGAYRIETSADSTDGDGGTWKAVIKVDEVKTHGQMHSFDFRGQRWVKLVVTRAPEVSPNGVQIDEIALRDVSQGESDTWFFMGDSITAFAFGRTPAGELGFGARVRERHPRHFPAVINGGFGGDKSAEGVRHIEEWLTQGADAHFWCIGYGTNDAAGDAGDIVQFKANLSFIIERVQRAGHVPILATIPYASDGHHSTIPLFNKAIDQLQAANGLIRGPDLYTWFAAHPDELRDGIHPTEKGIGSINRLWAEAIDPVYRR